MIIDSHFHYLDKPGLVDELLQCMDHCGIEMSILMSLAEDARWEVPANSGIYYGFEPNSSVLDAVKKHPDRLIGAMVLDPRTCNPDEEFDLYYTEGFRLVKLWPPIGYELDDERLMPMYEKCAKTGVPVLAHSGATNIKKIDLTGKNQRMATDYRYGRPVVFDMLCRLFPDVNFIMAHVGHPYYFEALNVLAENKNLYTDMAGGGVWNTGASTVYKALGKDQYLPVNFSKFIWGSDNCPQEEHMRTTKAALYDMGASDDDMLGVFGNTIAKLLFM